MPYGTVLADLHNDSLNNTFAPASAVFRNRIINGAMVIDQRYGGTATTNAISGYTVDRWAVYQTTTGKLIAQQNQGSVTPPAGFTKYLGVTSQSAYSVASSDAYQLYQFIEGYNIADLGWGTANAKTVTLSFQVYSSLTGTFGGSIYSSSASTQRSYPFSFTVSTANTWTQISITVPGDTFNNTFNTTNGQGLNVNFGLGSGSTYTTSTTGWQTGVFVQPTGTISLVGTNGAKFYITGVQLEVGTNATNFDYRPYGTELALCQRYYEKSFDDNVAPSNGPNGTSFSTTTGLACYNAVHRIYFVTSTYGTWNQVSFKVSKRSSPTMVLYGNSSGQPYYYPGTSGGSGGWGSVFALPANNTGWSMSNEYYSSTALCMTWNHWTANSEL